MPYDPTLVQPMREELTRLGILELRTASAVEAFLAQRSGSALLVFNSVCGCAAGAARPGVALAMQQPGGPDRVATVFAGQDVEATARARAELPDCPPSSPSFALLRDGALVHFVPRHQIEGRAAGQVATDLVAAFTRHLQP